MVIGVNPTSYLIYRMTGIRPLGRPSIPAYVFKSVEPSFAPFREVFGKDLKVRESIRGAYMHGTVLDRASQEMISLYQKKVGFDVDLEVGTFQTVSVEIEKDGWYQSGEIEYIKQSKEGTFLVKVKGEPEPRETEWIWSTVPLRVLMTLIGYKKNELDRVYIYRVKRDKRVGGWRDKRVGGWDGHSFDPKYELVYDLDQDSIYSRHVRIGIPQKPSTVQWYSEIWSLSPIKEVENLVKFYTVPLRLNRKVKIPKGIELVGTYSEWDYRINMTHVLEKVRELSKTYGIGSL